MSGVLLKSVDANRHLLSDGYVVIDLLNEAQAGSLRSAWASLAEQWPPIWDPTGMATTLRHPGLDFNAHRRIIEIVRGPISDVTEDLVCFMSTFVAKKPDSGFLPAHLDWRLVDEPKDLTFGCWIALQDVYPAFGALGVVPESHKFVNFDRTPESPGHEWAGEQYDLAARKTVLEMRAGQAVFFDHRLVHFSEMNRSEEVRLAAVLGISTPELSAEACTRLIKYMERGMSGIGSAPQIPHIND